MQRVQSSIHTLESPSQPPISWTLHSFDLLINDHLLLGWMLLWHPQIALPLWMDCLIFAIAFPGLSPFGHTYSTDRGV